MRNIMPRKTSVTVDVSENLVALGRQIRAHRKALQINATIVAEAAGMSRVTLHRIEKGEPAVTMGAYLSVMAALGLKFAITPAESTYTYQTVGHEGWIPARIRIAGYPQLMLLAWQVKGMETLTPPEAWGIYERNWRHLDENALSEHERHLIDALRLGFGGQGSHV